VILYRTATPLPHFLDCLSAQGMQDWHLVVVDNASPDESYDIVFRRAEPRVSIIRNKRNLGFAAAANQGLRAGFALGVPLCVLMNIDTSFGPEFLEQFVAARNKLDAAVIAPRIMHADRPSEAWYAGGHFENGWTFQNIHDPYDPARESGPRVVEFASGCCLGLTRATLANIGMLDESFFVYWEDVDLSLRLTQAGVSIWYVPHLVLLHAGAGASDGPFSPAHVSLYYCSYVTLLRKHFGVARAVQIMLRSFGKELERPRHRQMPFVRLTIAMLRGFAVRLRPIPLLDIAADDVGQNTGALS
jgi:GT2 family glycosyltransferase